MTCLHLLNWINYVDEGGQKSNTRLSSIERQGRWWNSSLQLIKKITIIIIKKKYLTVWLRRGRPGLFFDFFSKSWQQFFNGWGAWADVVDNGHATLTRNRTIIILLDYYCALIQLQVLTWLLLSSSTWPFFDSIAFEGLTPSDNWRRSISSRKASMSCWL
jgi:hypothetical protein